MEIQYEMLFGYLFISAAIGVFWIGAALDLYKTWKEGTGSHTWAAISKTAAIISFPLMVIGILLTLLHLGRIERFFYIILKFESWLTREAWSAGFFALFAFIYMLLWLTGKKAGGSRVRQIVGGVGIVLGLTTIIAMGMIYTVIKAIPSWNTSMMLVLNISYAFALGVFLLGTATAFMKGESNEKKEKIKAFVSVGFLAVLFIALFYFAYQMQLAVVPKIEGTPVPDTAGLLLARVLIGIVVPLLVIGYAWFTSKKNPNFLPVALAICLVLIVAGDILARVLHFVNAVIPPVFF